MPSRRLNVALHLLGLSQGERRSGRICRVISECCLQIPTPNARRSSNSVCAGWVGTEITSEARTRLLALCLGQSGAVDDPDGTVCACFSVGARVLNRAIIERRLTSIAEVGAALRAGTNCGSCIPEIAAILRDARVAAGNAS